MLKRITGDSIGVAAALIEERRAMDCEHIEEPSTEEFECNSFLCGGNADRGRRTEK
jgi:hypothetical protein